MSCPTRPPVHLCQLLALGPWQRLALDPWQLLALDHWQLMLLVLGHWQLLVLDGLDPWQLPVLDPLESALSFVKKAFSNVRLGKGNKTRTHERSPRPSKK